MENGQLNHLIQNPENADPIQLDLLIEVYPAISMLKVLKLKSVYESTGIIDQDLWDKLLIEWPDKKSLLKLKSIGFDLNKIMETVAQYPAPITEQVQEIENSHSSDSTENLVPIDHLGFIYELPMDMNQAAENQLLRLDKLQNERAEPEHANIDSSVVSSEPTFDPFANLPHLGFVYEDTSEQRESSIEITSIINDIQVPDNKDNVEENVQEIEIPTLSKSVDEEGVNSEEEDNSLSEYVRWLKALSQKQHFNISEHEQKKEMKKKLKLEKAEKDKEDRKDRSKTAKKLLKKSKKMQKDLIEKQVKEKKKAKKKSELNSIIESSLKKSSAVITETYADLLAKQGYIDQSIEMFEKLSLLNPEKSTYFAAKILKLKNN